MSHFCYHGSVESNKLYDKCSQKLDEIGREEALFVVLSINNDKIRLAIMNCILNVPLDELDENEILNIFNTLKYCQNIEEGENELVISTVYMIFTKFVLSNHNEVKSSFIF